MPQNTAIARCQLLLSPNHSTTNSPELTAIARCWQISSQNHSTYIAIARCQQISSPNHSTYSAHRIQPLHGVNRSCHQTTPPTQPREYSHCTVLTDLVTKPLDLHSPHNSAIARCQRIQSPNPSSHQSRECFNLRTSGSCSDCETGC